MYHGKFIKTGDKTLIIEKKYILDTHFLIKTLNREFYFSFAKKEVKLIASDVDNIGYCSEGFYDIVIYYTSHNILYRGILTIDGYVFEILYKDINLFATDRYNLIYTTDDKLYIRTRNYIENHYNVCVTQLECVDNLILYTIPENLSLYCINIGDKYIYIENKDTIEVNINVNNSIMLNTNVTKIITNDNFFAYLTGDSDLFIYIKKFYDNGYSYKKISNIKSIYSWESKLIYTINSCRSHFINNSLYGKFYINNVEKYNKHIIPFTWSPKTHHLVVPASHNIVLVFLMIIYRQSRFKQIIPRSIRYIIIGLIVQDMIIQDIVS